MSDQSLQRRKVRKGTRNCWECRRRKVKCTFASSINTACDNCLRRKSACVGQEYAIEPGSKSQCSTSSNSRDRSQSGENMLEQPDAAPESTARPTQPIDIGALSPPRLHTLATTESIDETLNRESSKAYNRIARDLLGAWPAQEDLDIIYSLPVALATHLHMRPCTLASTVFSHEPPSPQAMLQLPPPGSHPVLIARKLLVLGSLLQGALASSRVPAHRSEDFERIMLDAVDRASRLVNANDGLNSYIEGLECILIEAMFRNYAGDLHRAWMSLQRAAAIAHVLGLHHTRVPHVSRFLEPGAHISFDGEHLRLTIVLMDRYLSVTLGLPCSSFTLPLITPEAMAALQPMDRMARLYCDIGERVLRLNADDDVERQRIDYMLRKASAEMPPQWWSVPELRDDDQDRLEVFHQIARINYQLAHHHLTVRLYLHCMMRPPMHAGSVQGEVIVSNASREILRRCMAFRKWRIYRFYCRGIDYLAFIAVAILCVAHIHSQNMAAFEGKLSHLSHSRVSDRALMEQMVQTIEDLGNDGISVKLAKIMQYLLQVEQETWDGTSYDVAATDSDSGDGTGYDGEVLDEGRRFQLNIPYFGSIHLTRGPPSTNPHESQLVNDSLNTHWQTAPLPPDWDNDWLQGIETSNDCTMQNINEALFGTLFSDIDCQGKK